MKESEIRPQALFDEYLALARKDLEQFFSDKSSFVEVPCPACGSDCSESGLEKLGFKYRSCSECQSLYVSPRPPTHLIETYYREGEAVKFWATDFFKQTAEARREKIFRPRARVVAEWVGRCGLSADVFVDVGSGYGIFLEEVARLGLFEEVWGIEPAPNLAAVCRDKGFSILEKPAESIKSDELQGAFATAFEVLEHLFDPALFLQSVANFLKPGGMFLFTTLTVTGFDIQVLWEHAKAVHPPHHLNLISVQGMAQLVERCGWHLLELSTPGELDVDIVRNTLLENPDIHLPRFVRQIVSHPDEQVRNAFQQFLEMNRLSPHIRVVSRA